MASCPICGSGLKLKKDADGVSNNYVYCEKREIVKLTDEEKKRERTNEKYKNIGSCNFHIYFKNLYPKKTLSKEDMEKIINGGEVFTLEGHKLFLKKDVNPMSEQFLDRWLKPDEAF